MRPDFSLSTCICTRNRPDDLRRCLDSIAAGTRMPDQVVVSDDSDADKRVDQLVAGYPFAEYQRGPGIGLGANRNACIQAARGRYVSFIDDDVTLRPDFVQQASAIAARYADAQPEPIITGIEHKHTPAGTHRIEPHNADYWGYQRVPPSGVYRSVVINAALFPASLFVQARFDPLLRYGSDEIDMARHATALGFRIVFEPALQVEHFPSPINRGEYSRFIDASRMYSTAKDYLFYRKDFVNGAVFAVLAPLKLSLHLVRRFGLRGLKESLNATTTAWGYALAMRHQKH